jgi:2-phospho-L-lactate transferase/gluconeogenesis factor (CofD/UPF0052 family)
MTKPGETCDDNVDDHVREIVKYMGTDCLDYVIIFNTLFSQHALCKYAIKQQFSVKRGGVGQMKRITKAKIILADVSHKTDLLRHDSDKMMRVISGIIKSNKI